MYPRAERNSNFLTSQRYLIVGTGLIAVCLAFFTTGSIDAHPQKTSLSPTKPTPGIMDTDLTERLLNQLDAGGNVRVLVEVKSDWSDQQALQRSQANLIEELTDADAQNKEERNEFTLVGQSHRWPVMGLVVRSREVFDRLRNSKKLVQRITEDTPYTLPTGGGDPSDGADWELIHAREGWNLGARGKGVVLGFLDTGVRRNNRNLPPAKIVLESCHSSGEISACPDGTKSQAGPGSAEAPASSEFDHGAEVAALAVANGPDYRGVAPEANLAMSNVYSTNSEGRAFAFQSDFIAGFEDMVNAHDAGVPILAVNFSGGAEYDGRSCDDALGAIGPVLHSASQSFRIFVAAGNGQGEFVPACSPDVTSTAASDQYGQPFIPPTIQDYVDFMAPGVVQTIAVSSSQGTAGIAGSSAATAVTAGVYGSLRSLSGVTDDATMSALYKTAHEVTTPGGSEVLGLPFIDFGGAAWHIFLNYAASEPHNQALVPYAGKP